MLRVLVVLIVVVRWWFVIWCLLFVVCCLLCVVCGSFVVVVSCLLCVVCCLQLEGPTVTSKLYFLCVWEKAKRQLCILNWLPAFGIASPNANTVNLFVDEGLLACNLNSLNC